MDEYLEVSTREFLAALQRMLLTKIDHSNPKLTPNGVFNLLEELDFTRIRNDIVARNIEYFTIDKKQEELNLSEVDENGVILINY